MNNVREMNEPTAKSPSVLVTLILFGLAILCAYFLNVFTAWFGSLLVLLYLSRCRWWIGFLLYTCSFAIVFIIVTEGVIPIPDTERYVMGVIAALISWIPFALQNWAAKRFHNPLVTLVLPTVVVASEFAGSSGPFGTWGSGAYTQFDNRIFVQLLSLTGIWGVSFLLNWFGSVVWWWLTDGGRNLTGWRLDWNGPARKALIGSVCLAAFLVVGYGAWRLSAVSDEANTLVAAVPSLIGPAPFEAVEQWRQAADDTEKAATALEACREPVFTQLETLLAESRRRAADGAQLIVWSEAALASPPQFESEIETQCSKFTREQKVHLIAGLGIYRPDVGLYDNMNVHFSPHGEVLQRYRKSKLVPGEPCIPGDGKPVAVKTSVGNVASIVCFDADFPEVARNISFSKEPCSVLAVSVNDWEEVQEEHNRMCSYRAIENGIWIVRSSSNGISSVISPSGRIVNSFSTFEDDQSSLLANVGKPAPATLAPVIGDSIAQLCLAFTAILLVLVPIAAVRNRFSQKSELLA